MWYSSRCIATNIVIISYSAYFTSCFFHDLQASMRTKCLPPEKSNTPSSTQSCHTFKMCRSRSDSTCSKTIANYSNCTKVRRRHAHLYSICGSINILEDVVLSLLLPLPNCLILHTKCKQTVIFSLLSPFHSEVVNKICMYRSDIIVQSQSI